MQGTLVGHGDGRILRQHEGGQGEKTQKKMVDAHDVPPENPYEAHHVIAGPKDQILRFKWRNDR